MSNNIVDIDRTLGGNLWVVQEIEQLQRTFTKMVGGGLVNDSEDVWVKVQQRRAVAAATWLVGIWPSFTHHE